MVLLEAIARQEGYFDPPQTQNLGGVVSIIYSRPYRNHNPGDLIYGDEAQNFGALKGDPKFAVFPDVMTGWKALQGWLSVTARFQQGQVSGLFFDPNGSTLIKGYLGATLAQIINRFAPPGDGNNTTAYLKAVCANTGLTAGTVILEEHLVLPSCVAPVEA